MSLTVNTPMYTEKSEYEDKLEILSISEEEENGVLVKLNNDSQKFVSKIRKDMQYSIMDAAIKSSDTSCVLQPVREEQQRPNKLLRTREPLNQQKQKDSDTKYGSPPLDAENNFKYSENDVPCTSETWSMIPSHNKNQNEDNISLVLNRMDSSKSALDGKTKPLLTQSAVTSFVNLSTNFEPELVLSPAKLGQ